MALLRYCCVMFTEEDIQAGITDPAAEPTVRGFARLYSIIRILYGPGGCPWDREQTPESMREHLVEECYEVLDAIDQANAPHIQEELGDTALVITMIAHMYERSDDTPSVTSAGVFADICEKLVRRHPHVFESASPHLSTAGSNPASTKSELSGLQQVQSGDQSIDPQLDSASVLTQWEKIKQQEKSTSNMNASTNTPNVPVTASYAGASPASVLDTITGGLTPLERAVKLQKRAAKIGFDWPEITPVLDKVQEELQELRDAAVSGDATAIEDELGDILFSIINLARKLDTHPTPALNRANKKFEKRFRRVEELVREDGNHDGAQLELDLLDSYWETAKREQ